jgi:hypothetical protein
VPSDRDSARPEQARVNLQAARITARHLVEGWAVEASRRRKLADEYREHVLALSAELRELQRDAGMPEHDCPICQKAEAGPETGDVPL